MKFKYFALSTMIAYILSGCGSGDGNESKNETISSFTNDANTIIKVVRGPILHANVIDNRDQEADEIGDGKYKFTTSISYPIKVTGGYIDIDRDGKVSAGDVKNDLVLKTTKGDVVTIATTFDANSSTKSLMDKIIQDLNIPREELYQKTPLESKEIEAISNILYKKLKTTNILSTDYEEIKNEIKNEYTRYKSEDDHDSKHEEKILVDNLKKENKVEELDENQANYINNALKPASSNSSYLLLAWNDLGMHCMDEDFSVFSILPPYNNLNAQLIKKDDTSNKHIVSGVTITYKATQSLDGKINTTSAQKTNFWDYVKQLFGVSLSNDTGLSGNKTPSLIEQQLKYNSTHDWWEANGLPITPYNDDGTKNYYPMVDVIAKNSNGDLLATTKVVLPVSDEMDCRECHSSNSNYSAAKPSIGWENDADSKKDFKWNILKLHDEKFPNAVSSNQNALKSKGYTNYDNSGLYASAKAGNSILCATCHSSNALPGTGISGIKPLTEAIHSLHADVKDPIEGVSLSSSTNRSACYRCHPGDTTKCLRGAMGKQSNIQCQSCHGNMNAVGKHGRIGWLDQPDCQSCHQDGKRYTTAVTDMNSGTLRTTLDNRFATNPNTPMQGISLYRFSTGHGNMQCSACHGSTHAIYPSSHTEDNLQSIAAQGYKGTIAECTACHTNTPNTINGGPHGMHSVGQSWVKNHGDIAEHSGSSSCKACHGIDLKGSSLSQTFTARSFSTEWGVKNFSAGHKVSCYDCHNGPDGEEEYKDKYKDDDDHDDDDDDDDHDDHDDDDDDDDD